MYSQDESIKKMKWTKLHWTCLMYWQKENDYTHMYRLAEIVKQKQGKEIHADTCKSDSHRHMKQIEAKAGETYLQGRTWNRFTQKQIHTWNRFTPEDFPVSALRPKAVLPPSRASYDPIYFANAFSATRTHASSPLGFANNGAPSLPQGKLQKQWTSFAVEAEIMLSSTRKLFAFLSKNKA